MAVLAEIGIDLDRLELPIEEDIAVSVDLGFQARQAAEKVWGEHWPERVKQMAEESGVYELMVRTVWQAARILGLEQMPRLGLLNGGEQGMMNDEGYCWEKDGEVWVGLDKIWFNDIVEYGLDFWAHKRVREVLAEKVFHNYVRQVRPDLAEENVKISQLGDGKAYGKCPVEQAAKEFGRWYGLVSNEEEKA